MPTTAAQPPTRFSLADLVRLGQAGRPWEFLPLVAQALDQTPNADALRFLAAANLARLGLRTLALEQLALLDPANQDVKALTTATSQLPEDSVIPPTTLHAATLVLEDVRPVSDCFKTLDGNLVTRPKGETRLSAIRLSNGVATARAIFESIPAEDLSRTLLDGFCPHLFKLIYEATRPTTTGYAPRIIILQRDPTELLEQLALTDLSRQLADPRVEFFVGEDAAERLAAAFRARVETALPTMVLTNPAMRTPCSPAAREIVSGAFEHQAELVQTLRTQVFARYAQRDEAYWRERFSSRRAGPLRVLIPTSRYSTYIQHAAQDLAATLERQGHTARVLIEPDQHSHPSALAYLRVLDELDPDLVILINYPRSAFAHVYPPTLPYVCWIQDAMPHLFDPNIGKAQTRYDFLAGHVFLDLILKYNYPSERILPISVVADDAKFHSEPVGGELARQFECDIVFISHHSETPRAMLERLIGEHDGVPSIRQTISLLWPDIQEAAEAAHVECHHARLRAAVVQRLREAIGKEPDARTVDLLLTSAAIPLLDRILRHQTLEWAADICRRHNLRLHIHGNQWHTHPTLSAFAKGPLPHAEHLRAAYQCAKVTLHVSGTAIMHQRVSECFLSGGLCLTRLHRDAIAGLNTTAELALAQTPPDHHADGRIGFTIASHAPLRTLAEQRARLGYPIDGPVYWITERRRANQAAARNAIAPDCDPSHLLGDLTQTTFKTREQLEALVLRAVRDTQWRRATSERIAATARQRLTTSAFATRLLNLVATSFA